MIYRPSCDSVELISNEGCCSCFTMSKAPVENGHEILSDQASFTERLAHWAREQPDKAAWSFLDDAGSSVVDTYTYSELDNASTALANHLLDSSGVNPGDRVLLVFFPGLDFTVSIAACFKAGIIAVPVFPPDPRKLKKDLHHFVSIQESSGSTICLTHAPYNFAKNMAGAKNLFSLSGHSWPSMTWIQVDKVIQAGKKMIASNMKPPPAPKESDVAFLQYTSGSTSEPKGVMISHANLAHNLTLIVEELRVYRHGVCVSWLPQYHDMGLIGSYLGGIYSGLSSYYLSPLAFLKDATCWVRALSKYGATHTQAPNFAYALTVRKWKQQATKKQPKLDLSSLRHMINAAEPVDASAIQDFYELFRPMGLPTGVVVPTYGLAEHCVFVCSGGKQMVTVKKTDLGNGTVTVSACSDLDGVRDSDAATTTTASDISDAEKVEADASTTFSEVTTITTIAAATTQTIVGCGYPGKGAGVDVSIIDPETCRALPVTIGKDAETVPDNSYGNINTDVGEIWVNSPSKAQGYWELPEITKSEFRATVVPSDDDDDDANGADADVKDNSGSSAGASATYLRTGDLGFFYRGELFICGRIKDLIIIRGSNHYPQDIERSAESSSDCLRLGCSVAYSEKTTENAGVAHLGSKKARTETLTYVAECKPSADLSAIAKKKKCAMKDLYANICNDIRLSITQDHGLAVTTIVLVDARTIPKTTSGKVTRKGAQKGLQNGTLKIVHRWDAELDSTSCTTGATVASSSTSSDGISIDENDKLLPSEKPEFAQAYAAGSASGGHGDVNEPLPFATAAELHALPEKTVLELLTDLLINVTDGSPSPQERPVDPSATLLELGLDSMTIAQFKGALDASYFTSHSKSKSKSENENENDMQVEGGKGEDGEDKEFEVELISSTGGTGTEEKSAAAAIGVVGGGGSDESELERGIPDDFLFTTLASLEGLALAVKLGGLTMEQNSAFERALSGVLEEDDDGMVADIQRQPMCPWFVMCFDY